MVARWFVFSVLIAVSAAGFARAQDRDENWRRCADDNSDTRIEGCTALIRSNRETPGNLAIVFYNRGVAYDAKGRLDQALADYDRAIALSPSVESLNNRAGIYRLRGQNDLAIADYDQAIELNPNYAKVFNNRGIVYRAKGENDRAIADFDRAIALDPNSAVAFYSRGLTRFYLGQFAAATGDLAESMSLDPLDAYSVLWLHLARGRAGISDAEEFSRAAAKLDLGEWPGPLISLHLGEANLDQVREASARGDSETRAAQLCETAFYAGEHEVLLQNDSTAKALFQQAATTCPQTFEEYLGAAAELQRLK